MDPGSLQEEAKVGRPNPKRRSPADHAGTNDRTIPIKFTHGTYKLQLRNEGVTEYVEIHGREHSPTIDSGWKGVVDAALAFVKRFA